MLEWIARGLSAGRITMRWPQRCAVPPAELPPLPPEREPFLAAQAQPLRARAGALARSIHVRHVDCGSDGSEEWEIQALWNPYYDIQRLGFFLTAAPRHADVLLATGPVTNAMRAPLERTWEVMPEPKALVAVGDEACGRGACAGDCGLADAGARTAGGVAAVLPVDVFVPGSPPPPVAIMRGLLLATGLPIPGAPELVSTGEAGRG
jgi:Ni,Fe-hydrogenase III small subunit